MPSRFPSIEPPNTHHLSAVIGWLELGNAIEAQLELQRLPNDLFNHPDVIEVRWAIAAFNEDWVQGLAIAEQLVELCPERSTGWLHRSYATRRAPQGGVKLARAVLLPAAEKFPESPTIPYNLACYDCLLGHEDEARRWLSIAKRIGGKKQIQSMALQDPDLQGLWAEIKLW